MEDDKEVEVTYKFNLYSNREELKIFQKAQEYMLALDDIYNMCRTVWKYEEAPSNDRVELAEKIGEMISPLREV